MLSQSELWRLSKAVDIECFYRGQVAIGGDRKAKVIESFSKHPTRARRLQTIANLTMLMAVYPAFMQLRVLLELLSSRFGLRELNPSLFSTGLAFGLYSFLISTFVIFFGLLNIIMLMKGDSFDFLKALPLSRKDLQRVIFYTLIRMSWLQIAVVFVIMPIVALYISQGNELVILYIDVPLSLDKALVFITLFVLNQLMAIIFAFFVMIILARFLARKIYSPSGNPLLGTIFVGSAIFMNLAIIPIVFVILFILQSEMFYTGFLDVFLTTEVNHLLSLVPFLSTGYLSTALFFYSDYAIPSSLLITSLVGSVVFLAIILIVARKGYRTLRTTALGSDQGYYRSEISTTDITIRTSYHPVIALLKQSIKMIPRDFGGIAPFFTGMALPLLISLNIFFMALWFDFFSLDIFFLPIIIFSGIVPFFYNKALSSAEENIDGILLALPYSNRDHFRSRQIIISVAGQIPLMIIVILFINSMTASNVITVLKIVSIGIIASTGYLLLYSYFFGRINNRYTLFKVNIENNLLKSISLHAILYAMILGNVFLIDGLFILTSLIDFIPLRTPLNWYMLLAILVNGVNIVILEILARDLFNDGTATERTGKSSWYSFIVPALVIVSGMALMGLSQLVIAAIDFFTPVMIFSEDLIIANLSILLISQVFCFLVFALLFTFLLRIKTGEYDAAKGSKMLKIVILTILMLTATYGSSKILISLFSHFGYGPEHSYSAILLTASHINDPLNIILQLVVVAIAGPLFEEYLTRRITIPLLEQRGMAPTTAVVATSVIFALSHVPNDLINGNLVYLITHTWNVLLIGLTCGLAYIFTRNVVYPFMIHSLINAISFSSNIVVLSGDELLLDVYQLFLDLSLLIGLGIAVMVVWKCFKSPDTSWVNILRKKSAVKPMRGLIGFITAFIILVLVITVIPILIIVQVNDINLSIFLRISIYSGILVMLLLTVARMIQEKRNSSSKIGTDKLLH
ncbi:MAG: lysostaphin resistance A-like protein [Candidatus Odinarchaeota archaeon]